MSSAHPTSETPPSLADAILVIVRHWWLILLFAVVATVSGYFGFIPEQQTTYLQQAEFEDYTLVIDRPNLAREINSQLRSPEVEEQLTAALMSTGFTGSTGGELPPALGTLTSLSYNSKSRRYTFRVRAASDANLVLSLFPVAFDQTLDLFKETATGIQRRASQTADLYRTRAEEEYLRYEAEAANLDPEAILEEVRALLRAKEQILTSSLTESSIDREKLDERLAVIDEQLDKIDLVAARQGDARSRLFLESYQQTMGEYLTQSQRVRELDVALQRIEQDRENIDLLREPLEETTPNSNIAQVLAAFALFGAFIGVGVTLLIHALRQAASKEAMS